MTSSISIAVSCLAVIIALSAVPPCQGQLEELVIKSLVTPETCERQARKGDQLTMHYTGRLLSDGTQFDSSHDRSEPFKFQLGVGQVIKGWDQGLIGICVGEKRQLQIPSALAYGDHAAGDKIPAGSDLEFEVDCVAVEDGPEPVDVFGEIDSNHDKQLSREEVSQYLKKQLPAANPDGEFAGHGHEGQGEDGMPDQDKLVEEIFQHEDKDKNGFISHDEFSGPKHDEL